MSTLSPAQIYGYAKQAGFRGVAAVQATAIALAESGGRTDAIGDRNLTEPGEKSVGLWQINYRPSRDTNSTDRDPSANLDPAANAAAAFAISGQGRSFSPWTTYTDGAYRNELPAALKAASGLGDPLPDPSAFGASVGPSATPAASTDTTDLTPGGGGSAFGSGDVAKLILPTLAVLTGLALVGAGALKAATGRATPHLGPAAAAAAL